MKKVVLAMLAGMLVSLSAAATAQDQGDWVLSRWRGSTQYFPGIVQRRFGETLVIRFDDGTTYDVHVSQVRPYDWRPGTAVECLWTDGAWYAATITAAAPDGLTIDIRYEDGTDQRTQTGRCRSAG